MAAPAPDVDSVSHRSVLALVDTSPVLMLPSTLACRERFPDRPLHVTLAGPMQAEGALQRLRAVLERHGIASTVQPRADSLEATVRTWLNTLPADAAGATLDLSSASGGTAARAVLTVQREAPGRVTLCWFNEANNEVHFSNGSVPDAHVFDVGCRRSVRSAITPFDFMALFGLERAMEDPYCGTDRDRLVPLAIQILRLAIDHPHEYRNFRRVLAAARAQVECLIPGSELPAAVHPLVAELASMQGWVRFESSHIVFCGRSDQLGVFFLSGGWLEVAVAEAIRRALPEHKVQVNCGTTWGRRHRRAEAEMDVAFIYHNALYLLSCKNDHITDRFFPHLDRFRALTAEFGESRTRPVLLSTAELEPRHIRRCDAYEIGQISGPTLLSLIDRSLNDEPDALLKGLLTVSRGAPRAGLA